MVLGVRWGLGFGPRVNGGALKVAALKGVVRTRYLLVYLGGPEGVLAGVVEEKKDDLELQVHQALRELLALTARRLVLFRRRYSPKMGP